ncbi:cytochrome P450 4C1-like [Thrips palmi]|uniref:Cytochrome P450 4C1-like n=1 Tax=Thrips palmi TaxID=161013 RepID=A0A6P8YX03_THRPL|nr:cytochrome P450 4C1-like [Thrips palmi]
MVPLGAFWAFLQAFLLLAGLALAAAALLLYYDPTIRRAVKIAETYPQPSALPVVGHLLHILKPRNELFWLLRNLHAKFGTRFAIILFARPSFNLADPHAVEAVLSSSKHITKGKVYDFLRPWLGNGLLTSEGKLWHSRRKMLTPAFHFRILDQFAEHLEEQGARLVDELEAARLARASRTAAAATDVAEDVPEGAVDVVPAISRVTLRAICVTAMGKVGFQSSGDSAEEGEKTYFESIHRVGTGIVHRLVRPWLWMPIVYKRTASYRQLFNDLRTLHGYTAKVIAERKALLDDPDARPHDDGDSKRRVLRPFLDVLLSAQRDGADLSDTDIRHEVDTFMFEGHDTTSMALSWALELLGRHPEMQDKLVEELEGAGSDWDSVSRLPFLDRVLKECLRLRPSVPFIARQLDTDAVIADGQIIPAGAAVNVNIYDLHRHPDFFPDPERFDPDRFLPDKEQARHPFAYVPFSAGPRNCIGKRFAVMEMKLLLASVVRAFSVRSAMPAKLDVIADLVLRPRAGVYLELTPR